MTKLQAILLMGGDFNAANKIVHGTWMLDNTWKHRLMPEEIFSKNNRMANNGMLCKTLFYDITRQARVPAAIASVNASNCYNRIAHAMASMIFQAFDVPTTAIESMLGAIASSAQVLEILKYSQEEVSVSKRKGCAKAMAPHLQVGQSSAFVS